MQSSFADSAWKNHPYDFILFKIKSPKAIILKIGCIFAFRIVAQLKFLVGTDPGTPFQALRVSSSKA
jgi:hypothetical protein